MLILFLGTMAISLLAVWHVRRTYARYSRLPTRAGWTGARAAHEILRQAGIQNVEIVAHDERLGDHYDPLKKRLVLSRDNYHGSSPAALGVAAHEAGHALQHAQAYKPLTWRMAAVGATTFASQIVMWLPILGMFTGLIKPLTGAAIMAACWGVIMLFNLVTLPVEFDASRRAKAVLLRSGMVNSHAERDGVERVLNAAALTYVAAFITSLAYLLWHLLPLLVGGRERE